MALFVIQTNKRLWRDTWGLIISEENCPIYALCDWGNVIRSKNHTPILSICSPYAKKEDIINNIKNLFPSINNQLEIIYEKKWDIGLHQQNPNSYNILKNIVDDLPAGFYLAGDWTILPALEGAVLSGRKAAQKIIKDI